VYDEVHKSLTLLGNEPSGSPCTWQNTCYDTYMDEGPATYSETVLSKERVPDPTRYSLPRFNTKLNPAKLLDLVIMCKRKVPWSLMGTRR
jgi:hypothetical protein